jgi:hypothetical protein
MDIIYDKVIIPMNKFAKKHPNMPLIISITALLCSIILPLLRWFKTEMISMTSAAKAPSIIN